LKYLTQQISKCGITQLLHLYNLDHLQRPQSAEKYKHKNERLNAKPQVRKILQPASPNAVWKEGDIV